MGFNRKFVPRDSTDISANTVAGDTMINNTVFTITYHVFPQATLLVPTFFPVSIRIWAIKIRTVLF